MERGPVRIIKVADRHGGVRVYTVFVLFAIRLTVIAVNDYVYRERGPGARRSDWPLMRAKTVVICAVYHSYDCTVPRLQRYGRYCTRALPPDAVAFLQHSDNFNLDFLKTCIRFFVYSVWELNDFIKSLRSVVHVVFRYQE